MKRIKKKVKSESGFTLVELTMAMGLLLLVLGFTAEVLVNHVVSMDMTQSRAEAVQNADSVLNAMRSLRKSDPFTFPGPIVERWPNGTVLQDTATTPAADRVTSLPGETLTIQYLTSNNVLINGAPTAAHNPLQVRVTSTWRTPKGTASAMISTFLTNE